MFKVKLFRAGQQLRGTNAKELGRCDEHAMRGAFLPHFNGVDVLIGIANSFGHLRVRPVPAQAKLRYHRANRLIRRGVLSLRIGANPATHTWIIGD